MTMKMMKMTKKYIYRLNDDGVPGIYDTHNNGFVFLWDIVEHQQALDHLIDFLNTRAEAIEVQETLIQAQGKRIKDLEDTLKICVDKYQGLKEKMFKKKLVRLEVDPAYWAGIEQAYEKQLRNQAEDMAKLQAKLLLAEERIDELENDERD